MSAPASARLSVLQLVVYSAPSLATSVAALPMLLSVFVGTGVQTLAMSIITMCFAVLGFLSPANRGGLMTAMLLLFVFMGVPAGYSSAFLHKSLKGTDWKKNIVLTSWYCAQF